MSSRLALISAFGSLGRVERKLAGHCGRAAAITSAKTCLGAVLAVVAMAPLVKLHAAPPEVPAGHIEDLDRRQVVHGDDGKAPFAPGDPKVKEVCDLTLQEALRTGLKAACDARVRFFLVQTNDSIMLADFDAGARNTVSDIERAYWDLYYNYRSLNAVQAGRDNALQTWRKVHALSETDANGGEAKEEVQAREQYFLFRAQVENVLGLLYTAEGRLRYMMGLGPTGGQLLRPTDEPTTEEIRFDRKEVLIEALDRAVELSPDKQLELTRVLNNSLRDLDRNYQVSRTTFNRRLAAAKQVEAVKTSYESGTATLDMLLDAQRRLADAEIAYYRALVDYNVAILQVHFRKGSLLEHNGIRLAEGTAEETAPIDPFRPRVRPGE